jgi:hypothetical protein
MLSSALGTLVHLRAISWRKSISHASVIIEIWRLKHCDSKSASPTTKLAILIFLSDRGVVVGRQDTPTHYSTPAVEAHTSELCEISFTLQLHKMFWTYVPSKMRHRHEELEAN